jgi:hypothetical protein
VIAAPPSDGAVHETTDSPFALLVANTEVGASGTVVEADGMAVSEAAEDEPVPRAFVAVTTNE